jgi:hypothetical protein
MALRLGDYNDKGLGLERLFGDAAIMLAVLKMMLMRSTII